MRKTLLSAFAIVSTIFSFAQNKTEDFEVSLPEGKVSGSLYKTIQYIDSRYDTSFMGIVQLGAFNRKVRVVPETHLSVQLSNIVNTLHNGSAQDGELLFQLRQFNFAEITGATSEKGYCYLRASLYSKKQDQYFKLASIDTVIYIKSMDVTRALFRKASKTITDFIAFNLTREPLFNESFTYSDVQQMDNIEKRSIPVYNVAQLQDGIYTSFASFLQHRPDKPVEVEMKNNKVVSVKAREADGKQSKIKAKDLYAVVHNGQPYIATEFDYYPLIKKDNDFYFMGKGKISAKAGDVIAASLFFGVLGSLIASDAEAMFEMKVDHINGGFIRLKEVR